MQFKRDEVKLFISSLLRRAGLQRVSRKALAGCIAVCLVLSGIALWRFWPSASSGEETAEAFAVEQPAQDEEGGEDDLISVDVEGAVLSPGLYQLPAGSRVGDAVDAAGGMVEDALRASVNLARLLQDGEQVLVPVAGQEAQAAFASGGGTQASGLVNINTATAQELQSLDGIGQVLAQRIVDYRDQNGPFGRIEDLGNVSGIGDAKFAAIRASICV